MNSLKIEYFIFAIVLFDIMAFVFAKLTLSKLKMQTEFALPVATGGLTILVYTVFLFSTAYKTAMFFESIYFISTEWVCLSMLVFTVAYCGMKLESKSIWAIPIVLCSIDSVSLILNTWTKHSFDLVRETMESGMYYWICKFQWLNYVHFGWCYTLVLISLAILLHNAIKVPWAYKRKYITIFVAFMIAGSANAVCFAMKLAIDYSLLLYPLLAVFIYYYSIYGIPSHLLSNALKYVNESLADAILFFNDKDELIYKNLQAKNLISINGEFSEYKAYDLLVKTRKKLTDDSSTKPIEFFFIDGNERQFEVQTEDIYYGYNLAGSFLKLSDKTEEIKKYITQKYIATHDELTGVYNREHFFEVCDKKIKQNPNTEFIIFSSNIIQFKLINELFGEEIGDKVLIELTRIAKEKIHNSIIGRINDDKFCCLVPKADFNRESLKDIKTSLQKILGDSMHKINLRVGVCTVHNTVESAQLLYDKTQLVIKKLGEEYHRTFGWYNSDLMDELLRERQIINEFEYALDQSLISMYLQPFVDGNKNVSGAEALARWNHSTYGIIYPQTFIPVLERSGLVHKLDTFIWRQAAKTLAEWKEKKFEYIQISVNVSSKDIFYIDIPKEFETLLSDYNFNPKNLKIEFTESAITNDTKTAAKVFKKLKELGFEIGIDDFGHGYSSLNMLKDVNADILKMDMVLLQHNENPERARIILNFISQISRALGMRLISEGVETSEQLETLKKLGCDYFQGFYFSHPMTAGDFEARYLDSGNIYIPTL